MVADLVLLSICLVSSACSLWVQDGDHRRPLTGLPLRITPISHPHLYSSESGRFQAADLILDQVHADPNGAVIFHAMPGAGKDLLMAKLHGVDVRQSSLDQSLPSFVVYDQLKYNNGESRLYSICVNNIEDIDDPDPVPATIEFVERHQLNVKSVYVIIDTKAIDDDPSYLDRMHRYLTELRSQYERCAPLGQHPIKLVFNKVDAVEQPTLEDRVHRVQDKIADLAVTQTGSHVIATCAHESVGRLVASLRTDLRQEASLLSRKGLKQLQQRLELIKYQREMEEVVLKYDQAKFDVLKNYRPDPKLRITSLDAAALNWTSSALIDRNPLPDMSQLMVPSRTDSPSRQEIGEHAHWALNWIESGSNRALLADRMHGLDRYQDTKQQYDQFVHNCTDIRLALTRFGERSKTESLIKDKMTELKSSVAQYDADSKNQMQELERLMKSQDDHIRQVVKLEHQLMSVTNL